MCGIAGIAGGPDKSPKFEELQRMCGAMVHRGPDDEGFYLNAEVGLGMRRLKIIDLETGSQPVRNEDGSLWVVLNGEIYNYRELRRDLEQRGHTFYTATDTEVIVHLYEEYGQDCVNHMRGMFGFALWDLRSRTLMVARDRLGIKPLYYTEAGGRFAFASELKVLLQLPEVGRQLNWRAVNYLFSFLTTPTDQSIIEGVHKLEPGHMITLRPGGRPRIRRYWDVNFEPDRGHSEQYFIDRLRELLEESVRMHMVSDVPLGAFLSGGVDSSAVVATMARLSPRAVKTFSIGFREQDHDETRYARLVARRFSTDHSELILEPDITGLLEQLPWYLDEPFGDPSAIPTYMVSKMAAQEVKVVLSGDGGDELFAGYDKYVVEGKERKYQRLAAPVRSLLRGVSAVMPEGAKGRNFLRHFSMSGAQRYLDAVSFFRPEEQGRLYHPEAAERILRDDAWNEAAALLQSEDGDWLASLQYFDIKRYLPLDILTKVDRMSMAHSIEARVPLLDHKLVEFAATIPPALKLRGTTKYIFKRALRGILPPAVIDRPKQGFAVPLGSWFRGRLGGFLRDYLLSHRSRGRGLFNADYVERLIELHEGGRPLDLQLWTLLSFELWCRTFLDRVAEKGKPQIPSNTPYRRPAPAGTALEARP
ncbi:MAG TPA: asparagine synthase (glutamine-hydrolyzing) [Gammaproteobacteria bacterium]|nr:asparagine synthase (glutamine-hydrolyzing) [Gammaproteobacteria bacterium]